MRVRGDEWFHWYETQDGRPVALDAVTGFWVYLLPGAPGAPQLSMQRVGVGAPPAPAWRPSPSQAQIANHPVWSSYASQPTRAKVVVSRGTAYLPIVFADFSDVTHTVSSSTISNKLFATGAGVRSMATFYSEVSYGKFTVVPGPSGVQDWVSVAHTAAFYAPNPSPSPPNKANLGGPAAQFVYDAIQAAIAAGYNFAPYDQSGSGKVPVVSVVHAGRGEEAGGGPNAIWSHRGSLSNDGLQPILAPGGVLIDDYILEPEILAINGVTGPSTVGVFCHEYGHALGLPDLYDTTYASAGVGAWSVMGGGTWNYGAGGRPGDCPAHFDAWSKAKLGWITPVDYTLDYKGVQFPASAVAPFAARLWKDGLSASEYFLVENRYWTNFDSALPASGLLIWHIDDTKGVNNDNSDNTHTWYPISAGGAPPSTNSGNYHVALMQADNLWQLSITNAGTNFAVQARQNVGDAGDPFPGSTGNRVFGTNTAPNSSAYNKGLNPGINTYVTVSNISDPGPVMTADIYTRSPNSGPLADWVNIGGVVPPIDGAQFSELDAQNPVVISASPGASGAPLNQVQLYISRASDGLWWDFAAQQWDTNVLSSNYDVQSSQQDGMTLAFVTGLPSGADLSDGDHTFIVRVIDASAIPTEIRMTMTAAHVPRVSLSLANNSIVNTLTNTFTAFATEDTGLGIQRVDLAIYWDGGASEGGPPTRWYWSGTAWSTTPTWLGTDYPAHPSEVTEFYPIGPDARDLLREKQYTIAARAVDGFGDAVTNAITVFYDPGTPPTIYWQYPSSGNWFDEANWTPQRVPLPTDSVAINAPGDYTVTVNGDATAASLRFGRVVGVDSQHLAIPPWASFTLSGADTNRIYANGTLDLAGTLTANTVQFSTGSTWNWTNGTITGQYGVPAGAVLNLSGDSTKALVSAAVTSAGPATWSGAGNLWFGGDTGSTLINNGTFTVLNDSQVFLSQYGASVFVNNGTFVKAGGTSSITNSSFVLDNGGVAFNNNGTLSVQTGVLTLGGGGAGTNGTYLVAPASRIEWAANGFLLNGDTTFGGAGTCLVNGATVTLGGGANTLNSGSSFGVGSGVLAGRGAFAGSGAFDWTGGTIGATISLPATVSFNISGDSTKALVSASVTSAGPATWSGAGNLWFGGDTGSTLINNGTFTVLNDSQVFLSQYGASVFVNNGTFVKAGGTSSITNSSFVLDNGGVAFNNNGTLSVQTGILTFGGGGAGTNGIFAAASGARAEFVSGGFLLGGSNVFSGTGLTRVNGATVVLGGGASTLDAGGTLEVASGVLAGSSAFLGSGTFNWTGGTISATLSLPANVSFNLNGDRVKSLDSAVVTSAGPATWNGAGDLWFGGTNGSTLVNNGTFTVLNDSQVFLSQYGASVFVNDGTFVKAGGTSSITNTSFLPDNGGVAFNNNGTFNVQSGVVTFGGGGSGSNGTFAAASGARAEFVTGSFFLNGNTVFSGAGATRLNGAMVSLGGGLTALSGNFEVAAGTLAGSGTFTGAGAFNWTGGSISASLDLPATLALNLSGASDKTLSNGTISSAGPVVWSGAGNLAFAYGGIWNNKGSFTAWTDAHAVVTGYGTNMFVNNGTFTKAGGANTSFLADNNGVPFSNNGTVDLRSGVLVLAGGYTFSPTSKLKLVVEAPGKGTQLTVSGAAALAGTLIVSMASGFSPTNGTSFILVNYDSTGSQFSAQQLPALPQELVWQVDYDTKALELSVAQGPAALAPGVSGTATNQTFQFDIVGPPADAAVVHATVDISSTNLQAWLPIFTNSPFNGSATFSEVMPRIPPRFRGYRVEFRGVASDVVPGVLLIRRDPVTVLPRPHPASP